MAINMFLKDVHYKNIENMFNDVMFKELMDINIKQILLDTGMKCSFELNVNSKECYTDGRKITIGALDKFKDLTMAEVFALTKAVVGHEASHIRWSNFDDLKNFHSEVVKLGYNPNLAMSLANIIEDGRIERLLCNDLPGFSKYIKFLNSKIIYGKGTINNIDFITNLFNSILFKAKLGIYPLNFKDIFNKQEEDFIIKFINPRILQGVKASSHKEVLDIVLEIFKELNLRIPDSINEDINEELNELINDNLNPGYNTSYGEEELENHANKDSNFLNNDNTNNSTSNSIEDSLNNSSEDLTGEDTEEENLDTSDSKKSTDSSKSESENGTDLSKDDNSPSTASKSSDGIFDREDESNPREGQLNASDGNNSEGDSSNTNNKVGNMEKSSKNSFDGAKKDDTSLDSSKNSVLDYNSSNIDKMIEDITKSINDEYVDFKKASDFKDKKERSDTLKDNYYDIVDLDKINNVYPSGLKEPNFKYTIVDAPFLPYSNELSLPIKLLEKQFKSILRNDNSISKNQKKGRINPSSLWKVDSVYDRNIFKKKKDLNERSYAVYILIDLSGSMNFTRKYTEAINTALTIEGSLVDLKDVFVKTVGFNYTNKSNLLVFKDFHENKSRTPNAILNNYTCGSNRDGFAIRVALDDLNKHTAKNKLLIIISDGRPAWNGEGLEEAMKDVKEAVHDGRKKATIMSVLINDGPIRDYMKEGFHYMYEDKGTVMVDILNDSKELTNTLVLYLKRLFKRR